MDTTNELDERDLKEITNGLLSFEGTPESSVSSLKDTVSETIMDLVIHDDDVSDDLKRKVENLKRIYRCLQKLECKLCAG